MWWVETSLCSFSSLKIKINLYLLLWCVCTDVDECTTTDRPCGLHAICENASPGYTCRCPQGFTGKPDARTACEQVGFYSYDIFMIAWIKWIFIDDMKDEVVYTWYLISITVSLIKIFYFKLGWRYNTLWNQLWLCQQCRMCSRPVLLSRWFSSQ